MLHYVILSILAAQASPGTAPPAAAPAAPAPSADEERKRLEEQIAKELGTQAQPLPGVTNPPGPATASPSTETAKGGSPFGRLLQLPDFSAIVDGALGYTNLSPAQQGLTADLLPQHLVQPLLQEVELAVQAVIDPYARGDIFITFSLDSVEVEEAFLTTLSLPWGLQLKAGKFYSPFGRLNQLHRHQWVFVDQPLAQQRLVASDGLNGPGLDLAWLAPFPWFFELHLAYQDTLPGFESVRQLTGVARLIQYFELSDWATLGVGLSWADFRAVQATDFKNLGGADVFLKIRDPASRAYVTLQGEVFARQREAQTLGESSWGGYGQVVWRIDREWEVSARYDGTPFENVVLPGSAPLPPGTQSSYSLLGTFYASEFLRVRVQPSWEQLPGGVNGFQVFANFEFSVGVHGAHPY